MNKITIRDCNSLQDFESCYALQQAIWRLPDCGDCIPPHCFIANQESGGDAIGAWYGDELAGFVLSAPAFTPANEVFYYSQILGVLPKYQGRGIGLQLKKAQRDSAIKKGISKIVWTYDPLLAPNARLNIARLGAVAARYKENVYGEFMGGSQLTGGIPTDRFVVTWDLTEGRVVERLDPSTFPQADSLPDGIPVIHCLNKEIDSGLFAEHHAVITVIPKNFQDIIDTDRTLSRKWRICSRSMFQELFHNGYYAGDFIINDDSAGYVFYRKQNREKT